MSTTPIVKNLHPINHAEAQGKPKEILDLALKPVGFIPNMANAPGVLSTYLHGYALFRGESGLKPAEQEVVFLAVSQVNSHGRPGAETVKTFLDAGYKETDLMYIVLVLLAGGHCR